MTLFEALTCEDPHPIPPPPLELVEFRHWKANDSKREGFETRDRKEREFFRQEFIQEYLELKWKAELFNRDTYLWLLDYRANYMDKKNLDEARVIGKFIVKFAQAINEYTHPYRALRVDVRKELVEEQPPENKRLVDELNRKDWDE